MGRFRENDVFGRTVNGQKDIVTPEGQVNRFGVFT